MRIPLLCLLILLVSSNVFAEQSVDAASATTAPATALPQQTGAEPSVASPPPAQPTVEPATAPSSDQTGEAAVGTGVKEENTAREQPAPQPVSGSENQEAAPSENKDIRQGATTTEATPIPQESARKRDDSADKKIKAPLPSVAPGPAVKKNTKQGQRVKTGTPSRNTTPTNTVPPLLADLVDDSDTARQQATFWAEPFSFLHTLRPPTAAPPLLIGIRSQQAPSPGEEQEPQITIESVLTKKLALQEEELKISNTLEMLNSLIELQKNLKQQIATLSKKIKASSSESEKQTLQEELAKLDKQLAETGADFERLATGVESEAFTEKQPVSFSWKDEMAALLEPSIKELKQLTARARQKSELKETIADYNKQAATATRAIEHLNKLSAEAQNPKIKSYLEELLPAWQSLEKRITSKLDLAKRDLAKLGEKDVSLLRSSGASVRDFFRDRGWYLLIAFAAFIVILLACRLIARLLFFVLPGARREQRPIHVRILDIFFQIFSVISAVFAMIFVLYTAEDWFLLSATIVVFLGLAWTVRQTLPRMWQQMRLMLNMGAIREGERVVYENVPWKVESINVFCKLYNPSLGIHLRLPIENMIGLVSRPCQHDEPWFPCQKGDWVAIDGQPFAKVVSLSHEQVEVVELGGRRTMYRTVDFLGMSPANLSSNFSIRVVFGLSYDLQGEITTTVLHKLKEFMQQKFEQHGYAEDCLNLTVDFLQAGASSLDVVVLADFKGSKAAAYRRIERAIARWCVDCCNENNWEIPFPQMTLHLPHATTR